MNYRTFLLLPHLCIHNANAMSSPYTIGFPAMTAWLGGVHALQRRVQALGFETVTFGAVAVSCHTLDLQTYKGPSDFVHSIVGTANPLDKDGSRPAFIEEARCHLDVSLLIELHGFSSDHSEALIQAVLEQVHRMKFAGGDVMPSPQLKKAQIITVDEDDDQDLRKLLNKLMLGNVLIERRELMIEDMAKGVDALDVLLDYLSVKHRPKQDQDKVVWETSRKTAGWIVPIAVGFQGVSELGQAKNQRDPDTPHRFAESVLTLGEFVMPYRIQHLNDMLWAYQADVQNDLYLCKTLKNI